MSDDISTLKSQRDRWYKLACRYRDALADFGQHMPECEAFEDADAPCDCGLDEHLNSAVDVLTNG